MPDTIIETIEHFKGMPGGIQELGTPVEEVILEELHADIAIFLSGASAAEVAAGDSAVAALLAFFSLPVILILVVVILLLSWFRHWFLAPIRRIPWVGNKLADTLDILLHPIEDLEQWAINRAHDMTGGLIKGLVDFVHWCVTNAPHASGSGGETLIKLVMAPFILELNHLWTWVTDINTWVDHIWHIVEFHTYQHDTTNNTLIKTVDRLEQLETGQAHELQTIHKQVGDLYHQVQLLQQAVQTLVSHVHGVRAVNVGFQDIEEQIGTLEREISVIQAHQGVTLQTHTQVLTNLEPLGLLLEAGATGLANLRKLEDQPCQCPRLPHIPNEIGAALALFEFVENG